MNPKNSGSAKGRRLLSLIVIVAVIIVLSIALFFTTANKHKTAKIAAKSLYNNALLFAEIGKVEEALSEIDQAIAVNPKQSSFYAMRATYRGQLDSSPMAMQSILADLDRAIELSAPTNRLPYLEQRLKTYLRQGWFDNAIQDWDRLVHLSEHPEEKARYFQERAMVLRDSLRQFDAAMADFERAAQFTEQPLTRAKLLVEQAALAFTQVSGSSDNAAFAEHNYREAMGLLHNASLPKEEVEEQVENIWYAMANLGKSNALAICLEYFDLFKRYLQQQLPDEALFFEAFEEFAKTRKLTERDAEYHSLKASYYNDIYTWEDSDKNELLIRLFSKAIRLAPAEEQSGYLQKRAAFYDKIGRYDKAESDLRKAFPDDAMYHKIRAAFYDEQEEYEEADIHYRRLYDRETFYRTRATFYDEVEAYELADAYWKKILPSEKFRENRASYYDEKGMHELADPFLKATMDRLDFYFRRGQLYHEKGNYQQAGRYLDKAVAAARKENDNRLNDIYKVRAANYEALDRYDKADVDWKRSLPRDKYYKERASFYFCSGIVRPDAKEKKLFLDRATRYFEKIDDSDESALLERVYFYKLTNEPKRVDRDIEKLLAIPKSQRRLTNDLIKLLQHTETLDLFHRYGVDPCTFSEKLKTPWGMADSP